MEPAQRHQRVGRRFGTSLVDGQERVGARIALQRKLRGLTQRQLADTAGVSLSLLRKVEQGSRPATRPMVAAVAPAVGVDVMALTGQPYRTGRRREDLLHDLVPGVRRELAAYRLAPPEVGAVPSLGVLEAATAEVSGLRHRVDLLRLGERLPEVMVQLRLASHAYSGVEREQVMGLWAEVYYAVRQWLHKLGYLDLASLVADRYEWAAAGSGDPRAVALAAVFRSGELDSAGDWQGARSVMAGVVDSFDLSEPDPGTLSVWGFLHLMSAYMCAHAGDDAECWEHFAEARQAADRIGYDRDDYRLAFGPTNVSIWGTALAVELMDGAKAVAHADRVRLTPQVPPERAGHHWLDLARGQLLYGQFQAAEESLLAARRVAPQQLRYHPMARETVTALLHRGRRASRRLRDLATWMGLAG